MYVTLELNETDCGLNAPLTGSMGVGQGRAKENMDVTTLIQHGFTNINNENPFRNSLS